MTKRRLRPIEIAMLIVPLCALAFASWRMWNTPEVVVPPRYTLTDLGGFGGITSVTDLNDKGEITGVWRGTKLGDWPQVFFWKNGKLTLLKAWSWHPRINNQSIIVGSSRYNKPSRNFQWQAGKLQQPSFWSHETEMSNINDFGQTVGAVLTKSKTIEPNQYAAVEQSGVLHVLPIPSEKNQEDTELYTYPLEINNDGAVIVNSRNSAYLWSKGRVIAISIKAKNTSSNAQDINNRGTVIGNSSNENYNEWGWIWKDGQLSTLNTPRNVDHFRVCSINDHGAIVGDGNMNDGAASLLILKGNMFNLQELVVNGANWYLDSALKINNCGQIVGEGTLNGTRRFFLLTPQNPITSSTR